MLPVFYLCRTLASNYLVPRELKARVLNIVAQL
jgi:hypothetical protein